MLNLTKKKQYSIEYKEGLFYKTKLEMNEIQIQTLQSHGARTCQLVIFCAKVNKFLLDQSWW